MIVVRPKEYILDQIRKERKTVFIPLKYLLQLMLYMLYILPIGHHWVMVKLTCPRSTSRGYGTRWDLNSGHLIRIPH